MKKRAAAVDRTAVPVKKKSSGWDKKTVAGMLAGVKPEGKIVTTGGGGEKESKPVVNK